MTFTVADARALAQAAHAGQLDKQGRDYFTAHLTPIAAALRPQGEHAEMAGWLHDIVEDTEWTLDGLRAEGVPESVVRAVDSVSRREGEKYAVLITRACGDPLGVRVKLEDNRRNILDMVGLAQVDPDEAMSLLKGRYLPARDRLIEAQVRQALTQPIG